MSKIKIICNPYKKENLFQSFNNEDKEWVNINYENCPNSKLLSDSLHKGFFPFVVSKIVDEILNEYEAKDEKTELYFEGTEDDFNELKDVCAMTSSNIVLYKENTYLNNANTVLKEIIKVYQDLRPIITDSNTHKADIEENLNTFLDITKDVVPLCVMGNYSAGKSTFINALIGSELLPSGDEPLTAKVFKIKQADYDGFGCIEIQRNTDFMIIFNEDRYEFVGKEKTDLLVNLLEESLEQMKEESMVEKMNKALSIINEYNNDTISELIEITVPFQGGLWNQTDIKFVILDTPGSNSASNNEHLKVLEQALIGLTNGLAIYVSEYDSLDSRDNKDLYERIKKIEELDSRFTFIVVNKADENDLPEEGYYSKEREDEILNFTVPKNLYTEGIFFVSSILGLGSKTNGSFINKHLNKIYRKTKFLFDDKADEDYTVLYRYNIMPKQLKEKVILSAENSSEDLVYVNSGLYSVEQEIQNFANKYASYNKCKQSTRYLDNIVNIISEEIQEIISKREGVKQELKEALENDKLELINEIQSTSVEKSNVFLQTYKEVMDIYVEENKPSFVYEDIKMLENQYTSEQKDLLNFGDKDAEVKESFNSLKMNLKEGVNDLFKKRKFDSLKDVGKNFLGDVKDTFDDLGELHSTKREANKETAKLLLDKVKADYFILSEEIQNKIDCNSKKYWTDKSNRIKQVLSQIITGSTALSDDKRTEISKIIMTYRDIHFDQSKQISFELEDYVRGIKIGDLVLYESDKLNIRKVVSSYNKFFDLFTDNVKNTVYSSHCKTFNYWLEQLLSIIEKNIVNYSPELSEKQKDIEEETRRIKDLRERQEKINDGKNHINHMMNWKVNEE